MSRYYDPEIGQFISMDTPDYLDPETLGGVDLYAYCGYNPVMYMDPTGHLGIALTLLISAGIGLAVGAGIEIAKQIVISEEGWSWDIRSWNWDIRSWNWGEIGAKALRGLATGLAYGLGGVAGGIVKGSFSAIQIAGKTLTVAQSVGLLMGIAATTNFAAGMGAYALHTIGIDEDFNLAKGFSEALGQTGKGMLSFYTGAMYVASGV